MGARVCLAWVLSWQMAMGKVNSFAAPGVRRLKMARATTAPSTPSTKGKRLGQLAFIGRVAQGQRGGGMRVLGVFENWAGKYVGRVRMNMR